MIIRPTTTNDHETIVNIAIQGWRHAYASILPATILDNLDPDQRLSARKSWFNHPEKHSFVAEIKNQIVGFCDFGISKQPELAEGEIYAIYVLKDFYNKGIGRVLMTAAFNFLQQNKVKDCIVVAFAENTPALIFYERLGFHFKQLKDTTIENKFYLEKVFYHNFVGPMEILNSKD
ncbi:MAG: GNAT family N-acetyltransferase [Candidatus Paracaedibacteraceae bacterium]|nr:GNAT family N-acetyltransferase [Candidatus Paracaedibacteraceae bacterium]